MRVPAARTEDQALAHDVASLLYLQGTGGLAVSALAAVALIAMSHDPASQPSRLTWLVIMLLVLASRAANLVWWRKRRSARVSCGEGDVRRYGSGVVLTAALWGLYSLSFFSALDQTERAALAIVLSGMAGGSVTVLAPSRTLSVTYSALLLLPASLMFLITPGREYVVLGLLGLVFFVVMAFAAAISNRATLAAICLNRINQKLLTEMASERMRTLEANRQLRAAQAALSQTLESLECRIQSRTEEVTLLASIDPVTGLYNRQMLARRLETTLADAGRTGASVAVLFIDLDDFKEVNDVSGHLAGDEVLRVAAQRLSNGLPPETILARWGGDEFVLIAHVEHPGVAARLGAGLRDSLADPIAIGVERVRVGATVGIALFPEHGHTQDELIRAADIAMYAGKQDGRGRVRVFDPGLAKDLRERHLLEQSLREAIASHGLSLVFQPIVNVSTGRCEAMEALARWHHRERGPIFPAEFIPIAERSGDIVPMGRWVLSEACAKAVTWPGDPPPAVSVNVSVAQILYGSLLDDVSEALANSGLSADRLHIEVTESTVASDRGRIVPVLAALRERGVRISLDDFGTGFSSLAYLKSFPIDTIKIDKSFVQATGTGSSSIIEAIVSVSRALGMEVIAEGIETTAQGALLSSLGIHYLQGYLFSRPLPHAAACEWLIGSHPLPLPLGWRHAYSSRYAGATLQ